MIATPVESEYFVTGGTLPAASASYVERSADRDLLEHIRAGRFCYVLNSRQMGKSSLCVRTMQRLEGEGVRCAFVDLTKIGGRNVTPEQWYAGVSSEIARSLGMRSDVLSNWKENQRLSPVQRLFGSLREVVLEQIPGKIAIFFDEIDATRSLPFSADEFFAAIRECYNRRAQDSVYERLTFCLLGVAVPSDLINSPTSTPFNVGDRIYLRDFTLEEAMKLADGLPKHAGAVLRRIYYWTNGHPYLTQSLCAAAASQGITTADEVDAVVRRDLFDPKARETNINLSDVANRTLHAGDLESDPEKFRADLLSAYQKAWQGRPLADDEANRVAALLKMSGMMRSEGNRLTVRNRIYRHVFDKAWVRENMPGQELHRQRRAFWLGVVRTATVAAVVIAVVGTLAILNSRLAQKNARLAELAETRRKQAEYEAYVSDTNLMSAPYSAGDREYLKSLLDRTRDSSHRNIEWRLWDALTHDAKTEVEFGDGRYTPFMTSSSTLDIQAVEHGQTNWYVLDYPSLRLRWSFKNLQNAYVLPLKSGPIACEVQDGKHVRGFDPTTGKTVFVRSSDGGAFLSFTGSNDVETYVATQASPGSMFPDKYTVWATKDGKLLHTHRFGANQPWRISFSPLAVSNDRHYVAVELMLPQRADAHRKLVVMDLSTDREIDEVPVKNPIGGVGFSDDGRRLVFSESGQGGFVAFRDFVSRRMIRLWPADFPGLVVCHGVGDLVGCTFTHRIGVFDVRTGRTSFVEGAGVGDLCYDNRTLVTGGPSIRIYDTANLKQPTRVPGADEFSAMPDGRLMLFSRPAMHIVDSKAEHDAEPPTDLHRNWTNSSSDGAFRLEVGKLNQRVVDNGTDRAAMQFDYPVSSTGGYLWDCHSVAGPVVTANESRSKVALFRPRRSGPVWERMIEAITTLCLSPDNRWIAVGNEQGTVRLLDAFDGHEVAHVQANNVYAFPGSFSVDSRCVYIAAWGELVWRPFEPGQPLKLLEGSTGQLKVVSTADPRRAIGAMPDGSILIWDTETGRRLTNIPPPLGRRFIVAAAALDGSAIFGLQDDGTISRWSLEPTPSKVVQVPTQ